MTDVSVTFTKNDHIASIKLNRPYIDQATAFELAEICTNITADNDIYVVILTGSGDIFCNGGDKDLHPAASIADIEQPVIAAVNGDALGVGMALALASDIRLAAASARFALPQVKDGLVPADGSTQRLPRIVGRGKALEILLTAQTVFAADALDMGLVSGVYPTGALAEEAQKLAATIAAKGPIALRYLKEAVLKGMDVTLEQGLKIEADLYFLLHTTSDRTEGIKSFLEKRPPKYEGK